MNRKPLITETAQYILEKHCPSMHDLYMDSTVRAFRERIFSAMKEVAGIAFDAGAEHKKVGYNSNTPTIPPPDKELFIKNLFGK